MRNAYCRTWNMARNTEKLWKKRNAHFINDNIVRKLKKVENEKHTLYDVKYGKKL